ncbi:MAG: hypothetical protein OEY31_09480, partial [Candidatus Bathyarchaeota archaeon]|nr:hypothetical protein [Candidatus Bathyarchaeota archaeon]
LPKRRMKDEKDNLFGGTADSCRGWFLDISFQSAESATDCCDRWGDLDSGFALELQGWILSGCLGLGTAGDT